MKISKILIVGFGSIGEKHYNYLSKYFKNIQIGILLNKRKKNWLKKNLYYSLEDTLKFKPDAVIICSPSNNHYEHCLFFARNKIHILVEKPIFNKIKPIKNILYFVKKHKLVFKIGYNLRYSYLINQLKKSINKVGQIYFVNCDVGNNIKNWRTTHYSKTVSSSKDKGGGVILELSHEIDYLNWIFGNFTKVYSNFSKISNLKLNVEDNAQIIFVTSNKKNPNKSFKILLTLDFLRHNNTRLISIIGEKGTLKLDLVGNTLSYYLKNKSKWRVISKNKNDISKTYLSQFKDFKNIKIKKQINNYDSDEFMYVLKIIEMIKKSQKLDKAIKINS